MASAVVDAAASRDALAALRADHRRRRDAAIDAFRRRPAVSALIRTLAAETDLTLRTLWRDCGLDGPAALAAVGGYG
ncbi:MAG TPA: hypothetical protein VM491_07860, partial [Burkholderiaceae bacterium]|nr:hypothetical protein [Burkholderiaceae bacterium]